MTYKVFGGTLSLTQSMDHMTLTGANARYSMLVFLLVEVTVYNKDWCGGRVKERCRLEVDDLTWQLKWRVNADTAAVQLELSAIKHPQLHNTHIHML